MSGGYFDPDLLTSSNKLMNKDATEMLKESKRLQTVKAKKQRPSYTDKEVEEAAKESYEINSDVRKLPLDMRVTLTRPKTTAHLYDEMQN